MSLIRNYVTNKKMATLVGDSRHWTKILTSTKNKDIML